MSFNYKHKTHNFVDASGWIADCLINIYLTSLSFCKQLIWGSVFTESRRVKYSGLQFISICKSNAALWTMQFQSLKKLDVLHSHFSFQTMMVHSHKSITIVHAEKLHSLHYSLTTAGIKSISIVQKHILQEKKKSISTYFLTWPGPNWRSSWSHCSAAPTRPFFLRTSLVHFIEGIIMVFKVRYYIQWLCDPFTLKYIGSYFNTHCIINNYTSKIYLII